MWSSQEQRPHLFFFIYSTHIIPYVAQGHIYSKYLIDVLLLSITGPWFWLKFANKKTKYFPTHMCIYTYTRIYISYAYTYTYTFICKYVYILYLHIYAFLHIYRYINMYVNTSMLVLMLLIPYCKTKTAKENYLPKLSTFLFFT